MTHKLLLAIGNQEIEENLSSLENIEIIDSDSDIDFIVDVLNYENIDYIIANTLLSESKSLNLAKIAKEKECKVIAIVENYQQKEFIAAMVGLGVKAFVNFGELNEIAEFINDYPKEYDFSRLQQQQLQKTKSVKEKVKTKVVEVPQKKIRPVEKRIAETVEQAPLLKMRQSKMPMTGKVTIAIFNICSGAGATQTAILLAESLADLGQNVICVSLDKKQEFLFLNSKKCSAEYFIPESLNDSTNFEHLQRNKAYQIVIYDFGRIFEFEPNGNLKNSTLRKMLISEFMRCKYKIGLSFSDCWHQDKNKYFLENEEFFDEIESGQFKVIVSGANDDEIMQKYEIVDIYKRNELDHFIELFATEIGLV